jgi:hypothetical protein
MSLHLINRHNGSSGWPWKNGGTKYPSILHKKMSPFLALYGYHPPFIISPLKANKKAQEMEDHIGHQQEVLKLLKDNLVMEQNRMKQQVDQHHIEREFEVEDWVFFRLQPYKYMSLKKKIRKIN